MSAKTRTRHERKNDKAWGGRFKEATAPLMERFNASLPVDYKLALHDIDGSEAHADMLRKIGVLSPQELERVKKGFKEIRNEIKNNTYTLRLSDEDVHMSIERRLVELIGPVGGKVHTARSRNDQVALDVRLYCREFVARWHKKTLTLLECLVALAEAGRNVILPGYTHLQRAQPVSLAHHLLAHAWMSTRDLTRIAFATTQLELCPLGAGALAGTTLPIDRAAVAKALAFSGITPNSIDTVSDRDFILDILSAASIQMMHLSRLCEELVLWSSQEFGFVQLPQGFCTGSSMMPQKMNPDAPELIRGKAGRVYGNLMALLTVMKGLPLSYNKDMQEDKEPLFDTAETLELCLEVLAEMLPKLTFNRDNMRTATREGFVLATDLADHLVRKGLPFRDAHAVIGAVVQYCVEKGTVLEELSADELYRFSPLFDDKVKSVLNVEESVKRRRSSGGTAPAEVAKQLAALKRVMKKYQGS